MQVSAIISAANNFTAVLDVQRPTSATFSTKLPCSSLRLYLQPKQVAV